MDASERARELRDISAQLVLLSRRLDAVAKGLPAELIDRLDCADQINPSTAEILRCVADELERQ